MGKVRARMGTQGSGKLWFLTLVVVGLRVLALYVFVWFLLSVVLK